MVVPSVFYPNQYRRPGQARDRNACSPLSSDPKGRLKEAAFFSTCPEVTVQDVLSVFARRWELEVAFRNVKQHLGFEETANGFTRRRHRQPKRSGPQAMKGRQPIASSRTAPFAFIAYGVVLIWYLKNGDPQADITRARLFAPWYRHKSTVSFTDMLESLRQKLRESFSTTQQESAFPKSPQPSSQSIPITLS